MPHRLRHLSYANVVASLALFVTLGGVSYAAIKLPANSVGSRELKSGAVTGAKVKDRSLFARDFKAGQLPRGATGPKGDAGASATLTGLPAGGALTGTYPNPGIAPGAVTGATVADNSLTGADVDESTFSLVGFGFGQRFTSGGDIAPGAKVTLFDMVGVGRGELSCDDDGDGMRLVYTPGLTRVVYESLAQGAAPVVDSQVLAWGSPLELPIVGTAGNHGAELRLTAVTADGAGPLQVDVASLKVTTGCSYVAETRAG